jgi:hypothetical protein
MFEDSATTAYFVAVGEHATRMISSDGETWTQAQFGKEGEIYRAVALGNQLCVAVGSYGGRNLTAVTVDGVTWERDSQEAKYVNYLRGVCFGNGLFLGIGGDPGSVGDSKPFTTTTTDGRQWSEYHQISGKNMLRRVCYGNDRFVGVGDRGRRAASPDGKTWTDAPNVKALDTLIDLAFGRGIFVGVGLHGLRMSSEDGVKWSERISGEEGEHINSVAWTGELFVAVGQGATYVSPDGLKWERHANQNAPLTAVYGNKRFVGSNLAWAITLVA